MKKRRWAILLVIILAPVGIAALGILALVVYTEVSRPPDEWGWLEDYTVDQQYFTAKEAYRVIQPLVLTWHPDAVVTSASAGYLWSDVPTAQLQPDGRNGWWHFIACSDSASKWVSVVVDHGAVGLGVSDHPWGVDNDGCPEPLSLESIIDSDEATFKARCLANGLLPHHAGVTRFDSFNRRPTPESWIIDFAPLEGGTIDVLIDGETGAVTWVVRDSEILVPFADLPTCP